MSLNTFKPSDDLAQAVLTVQADRLGEHPVSRYITGKFCEHLWSNIYNGMEAQILQNPTFGDWPFCGGGGHPDGGVKRIGNENEIADHIRTRAERLGWPDAERLVESRQDSLAHWWIKEGPRADIRVSPDAASSGQRAQRVETQQEGQGIGQWVYLPLHRVRTFEYRIMVRSADFSSLTVAIHAADKAQPVCKAACKGIDRTWRTLAGTLAVPAGSGPDDGLYRVTVTAPGKGQFVIGRLLIYPADHVNHADPDVIRMLKESKLPVLRWPGGNFVSGYHWKDGIGPVDSRPTRDNPAWAHIEPGMFGTDEFMAFCRAVGCEPMICINAGNGTPQEAAEWLEYCNGAADTPMGKLRAANGHPEPYGVKFWEIGNELSGTHQVGWTTSAGYADRFREFGEALLAVDPAITILACGGPVLWGGWDMQGVTRHLEERVWTEEDGWNWNRLLIRNNKDILQWTTDHILEGGAILPEVDPHEVCRDFMAIPIRYEAWYGEVEKIMREEGIKDPRLAITELQLFGRLHQGEGRMTHANLVNPSTAAESVYQRLFYHMAVRLSPFIPMITHSATVNHGGGLRKQKERVYANPCHYNRSLFAAFADAVPCGLEMECGVEKGTGVLQRVPEGMDIPVVDAVAAFAPDGSLLLSIVHRGCCKPVGLTIKGLGKGNQAEVTLLSADEPWVANTLEEPDKVKPVTRKAAVKGGELTLDLPVCSVTQVVMSNK